MLFNSFPFLLFFGAVTVIYYAVPHRHRLGLLLAASLGFYGASGPSGPAHVFLLLAVAAVAYWGARAIEGSTSVARRRTWLALAVATTLCILFVDKYYGFLASTLGSTVTLPRFDVAVAAGLSFYTFSCVSYLVDVHKGKLAAERHAGRFVLYVAFFPKLLAGPIERAPRFLPQLDVPVRFIAANVTAGLQLLLWGLVKKVVIADRLAPFVDAAYGHAAFAPVADLVLATYLFAFQLYCDFSGYSDMAIGAAKVLGFDLMENFRRPYLAPSVREFWSDRWHLSLTAWFRDYLYIPLGGSRISTWRTCLNVMAVYLVSGLWHGANWTFVVWGGLNGLYQVAGLVPGRRTDARTGRRAPGPLTRILGAALTFHLILVTWVFFRAPTLGDAMTILSRTAAAAGALPQLLAVRLQDQTLVVSFALVVLLVTAEVVDERRSIWTRLDGRPVYLRWAAYYALVALLFVLGRWNLTQFVYMQF